MRIIWSLGGPASCRPSRPTTAAVMQLAGPRAMFGLILIAYLERTFSWVAVPQEARLAPDDALFLGTPHAY